MSEHERMERRTTPSVEHVCRFAAYFGIRQGICSVSWVPSFSFHPRGRVVWYGMMTEGLSLPLCHFASVMQSFLGRNKTKTPEDEVRTNTGIISVLVQEGTPCEKIRATSTKNHPLSRQPTMDKPCLVKVICLVCVAWAQLRSQNQLHWSNIVWYSSAKISPSA